MSTSPFSAAQCSAVRPSDLMQESTGSSNVHCNHELVSVDNAQHPRVDLFDSLKIT